MKNASAVRPRRRPQRPKPPPFRPHGRKQNAPPISSPARSARSKFTFFPNSSGAQTASVSGVKSAPNASPSVRAAVRHAPSTATLSPTFSPAVHPGGHAIRSPAPSPRRSAAAMVPVAVTIPQNKVRRPCQSRRCASPLCRCRRKENDATCPRDSATPAASAPSPPPPRECPSAPRRSIPPDISPPCSTPPRQRRESHSGCSAADPAPWETGGRAARGRRSCFRPAN